MTAPSFVPEWRRRKSAAFELANSTGGGTVPIELWGRSHRVYANANLSIYSAQECNARCSFCVEELRPASRGTALSLQKRYERDDGRYFDHMRQVLEALRPLDPSVSVTGGEPSKDPRLPRILRTLAAWKARKRTLTTNGSGLLDVVDGERVVDWLVATGVRHLNISRAHPDHDRNACLMRFRDGLSDPQLENVITSARRGGVRVRLSCVLLEEAIDRLSRMVEYLEYAERIGVDNVIFRQLMKTDPSTVERNHVVRYSDRRRVCLETILDQVSKDSRFRFQSQIVGYYYYVEVWRFSGIDVVFEEADLGQLERSKRTMPGVVHELVFHPNAQLASTWQPWDGILGPPESEYERGACLRPDPSPL